MEDCGAVPDAITMGVSLSCLLFIFLAFSLI